jgi:hypothetical protein
MSSVTSYDETVTHGTPVTGFQWIRRRDGQDRYEATGTCPVCRCSMTKRWPVGQYTVAKGGFLGREAAPDSSTPWYTVCTCRSLHMGRPAGEDGGCGAGLFIAPPATGLPQ